MPVCRSASFSTQEGRKYRQFQFLTRPETEAYFDGILSQTLLSESKFPPLKLEEGSERNKAVVDMVKIQKRGSFSSEVLHLAVRMADLFLLN